ncbi:MAG: diguanylate cyclase [Deltaproteobacteria bacterium]|nr:diguanylate cyclase [Deltaproteobacteria bacterium]
MIAHSYIIHENGKLHATVSIGAAIAKDDDTMDSLIKRADTLMYTSKEAGRNCLTSD